MTRRGLNPRPSGRGVCQGDDHDATLAQYQAIAEQHKNVHVYSFDQVSNPAEIAEDMAIAVLPQSA